jgi:hypothetical protein
MFDTLLQLSSFSTAFAYLPDHQFRSICRLLRRFQIAVLFYHPAALAANLSWAAACREFGEFPVKPGELFLTNPRHICGFKALLPSSVSACNIHFASACFPCVHLTGDFR